MWWMNLVKKVQRKLKTWRLLKICKELGLMVQLGGKKMRRTIRGAQAGLSRFARHQKCLISHWVEMRSSKINHGKRREGGGRMGLYDDGGGLLVVPADLSSPPSSFSSSINIFKRKKKMLPTTIQHQTDGLDFDSQTDAQFDDLDVISLDDHTKTKYYWDFNDKPQKQTQSRGHGRKNRVHIQSAEPTSSSSSCESCSPEIHGQDFSYFGSQENQNHYTGSGSGPKVVTTKGEKSYRKRHRHRPRSHPSKRYQQQQQQNEFFTEQQNSQRSAFLDFLFEDSPSPSKFLTSQALQNILGCPSCRDIVSILPSDISSSLGCEPCEQCLETKYSSAERGKCLLCECSYGETKSLLLEKLTMRCWIRPCVNRRYGCQSLVGKDLEHTEEECTFQPRFHCPFMLCRRKFPKGSLIKHLHSEHHLYPHDGAESEGTIFCLPNNKKLHGARANYTLDPCALSCYGNIFILRILRMNSLSWYIWVWTLRVGDREKQPQDTTSKESGMGGQDGEIMDNFPYTIRFRQPASRSQGTSPPRDLTLRGLTVSLRLSMEEIMERGLCNVLPEKGSLFDCSEENVVDFQLSIYPTKSSTARLKFEPKGIGAGVVDNRRKSH